MNKKYLLAVVASIFMFAACGDDVTEVSRVNEPSIAVLDAGQKLSKQKCDTSNVGELLYVKDSSAVFVCDGKGWNSFKGEAGKNGKDGENGKNGKNGLDGNNGENGENGIDGKDGSNCSVKKSDGKSVITCTDSEGEVVSTTEVKDGADGAAGKKGSLPEVKDGENGESCMVSDNSDGTVTITCGEDEITLNKAVCGSQPYDPANQECFENKVFDIKPNWRYLNPDIEYGIMTDERDGQYYKTMTVVDGVDTYTWMAENMNYADSANTESLKNGASRCYNDKADSCEILGRLYTWKAAQDVCPEGWFLPNESDWRLYLLDLMGQYSGVPGAYTYEGVGVDLAATTGWNSLEGADSYGFSALPAGWYGNSSGKFSDAGLFAYFWTSQEESSGIAYYMDIEGKTGDVKLQSDYTSKAFSVRCMKNFN